MLKRSRRTLVLLSLLSLLLARSTVEARPASKLDRRLEEIMGRPEFRHARFGVEVLALDTGKVLAAVNADALFVPGSTTKLLTEGTALELLGPDFRFVTRLYRTGPVSAEGTLDGDLVWVASGDPNISGRILKDGSLAFENGDHSYAAILRTARPVDGDPLGVVRAMARQVAGHGVKRIRGRVLVDARLFPEGDTEPGTNVVISPAVVNDNLVDLNFEAGASIGGAAKLTVSPESSYARFTSRVTTSAEGSKAQLAVASDVTGADGAHDVIVEGSVPAGTAKSLLVYKIPEPGRFAQRVLMQALEGAGVALESGKGASANVDFEALSSSYQTDHLMAEHTSPSLAEEVKVTLKVSQNLHATITPFVLGATLRPKDEDRLQAGFDLERAFLEKAGLDLTAASQSDGAGGTASAFTPDFLCRYLAFMSTRRSFPLFEAALPILGRDGTLAGVLKDAPAAGHVRAKTGTAVVYDALNQKLHVAGKALAGYVTTRSGRRLAFAAMINQASVAPDVDSLGKIGTVLAEIAASIYDLVP
jgi:D-alanyl-D-alanine carboxypeptidase/D-alanyl-D-alanine-endopeptidase (penicillin-binding protein 4)